MKKLFIGILSVLCLITLCAGLTACAKDKTEEDKLREQGYLISVRYDAGNGGKFLNQENRYVLDMFNPSRYTKDASGKIYIKLLEPTDKKRGSATFSLTREGYFYAGWYQKRELVRNAKGEVVDEQGKTLYQEPITEEFYYDEDYKEAAVPAYTYSDPWDFDKPLEYTVNGEVLDMTLYAAWVPYFSFEYYAKNEKGEWAKYGETSFNYKFNSTAGADGTEGDLNVCYLPDWSETVDGEKCGYMKYDRTGTSFTFPDKFGYTFKAAYTDLSDKGELSGQITTSIRHSGSMDYSTATAINPVQKIYVDFDEGTRFIIATAKQLADNASSTGMYTLIKDLDFNGVNWPAAFESGTFQGVFDGGNHTVKNVTAKHATNAYGNGGLFGKIAKDAEVKDVTFENATLDISNISINETFETNLGMFSGNIETGAKVSNISLVKSTIRIKADIPIRSNNTIYMLAGGDSRGVTSNGIDLVLYGAPVYGGKYLYSIDFDKLEDVEVEIDKTKIYNKEVILKTIEEEEIDQLTKQTILEEYK